MWGGSPQPTRALAKARPEERSIFLAHEPDVALLFPKDLPIAIQLSGHTHGGQVSLPPGKPIRLPKYGRILARGLYETQAPWPVYVNRGIGTLFPHVRFAASPEITLMEVQNVLEERD
jgi:predicted MPP superfamily phosphohydrolase